MAAETVVKKSQKKVIDLLIKCPRCGNVQHEYLYSLYDKNWFKCTGCQELFAAGAWKVLYVKMK